MKSLTLIMAYSAFILFTSCVSSVSTNTVKKQKESTEVKGRKLLQKAWIAQGMDKLNQHEVYQTNVTDTWKGPMGRMAKMWPEAESDLSLKYAIGSFDGQVEFLDGKRKGDKAGLQSWKYYTKEENSEVVFKNKPNPKIVFGINAYQYFFELIDRLRNVELVAYAGKKEFKGQTYDLVLITWEKLKAHKEHDQYTVWINRKNNRLEFCEFTIHDPYVPGGALIPGSIEFSDFRSVDGIQIPFLQHIYIGSPKKKQSRFLHRLTVHSFEFDSFDEHQIYPNSKLERVGDHKL